MNSTPIAPAALSCDARGLPFSAEYRDIYHPRSGALVQARHVFIGGNALPQRWQERDRFVVLETGFGLGNNFLATWQAWRDDPRRCARLVFISVEQHPLTRADLIAVQRESAVPELADALQRAWPPLTHNLHRLSFDDDRVELLLALGDVQAWLPELVAEVDAFYLDGFAPDRNPRMWDERVCKALGRLANSSTGRAELRKKIGELLVTLSDRVRNVESQSGHGSVRGAIEISKEIESQLERLRGAQGDDHEAKRIASNWPQWTRDLRVALEALEEMKKTQNRADEGAGKCETAERALQEKIRGYVGDPTQHEAAIKSLPEEADRIGSPIKDFYLTNAIARSSPTMQRCSAELLHGDDSLAEAAE